MPALKPEEILRYLRARGFLSGAEFELVSTRWSPEREGPLLPYLGREKLLPEEVVEDLIGLIGDNRLEGLEPHLPGLILLSMIGRGGRGTVYRAWQPGLRRVVAVKVLNQALGSNREYIRRFLREARVASKVQHRNIVRAFDINKKDSTVYMVMEYVAGVSVGGLLRRHPTVEFPHAIEVARLIAGAIAYVGQVGLVHRDIKPDNIMIDRHGRVKLCDLGLARPSGSTNLTSPMIAQGTPAYMAPEAATSPDIDIQADVYSLGVTLYRMVLGKVPFDHKDPVEVLRMHIEERPRGLDDGELPGAVQDLIRTMLEKDPRKRPDPTTLVRELLALQKSIPALEKHRLWELVPGGEPTRMSSAEQEALSLEPTDEMARPRSGGQAPAAHPPWEDPALAPRPERRPSRVTGMGIGTLAFALIVSLLYILLMTIGDAGSVEQDESDAERADQLERRVSELEEQRAAMDERHGRHVTLMQQAANRLELENELDLERMRRGPHYNTTDEIVDEIESLRDAAATRELPGAAD